jgi:hypothetical protein
MTLLVRPFAANDTNRLRAICHQTALERPFLPYVDEPRFALAFHLDPYLEIESESCFVAELDGEIAGYIVGTCDSARFQPALHTYLRKRLPGLLWLHATGITRYRTGSHRILLRMYLRMLRSDAAESLAAGHGIDLARYPAHCHLQVAPEARARRAGLALMLKFHEHLKSRRVPGQYSSVVEQADQEGYSRMLIGLRFRLVHEQTFTCRERPSLIHSGTWRERVLVREF